MKRILVIVCNWYSNRLARRAGWDGYKKNPHDRDSVIPWLRGRLALWAVRGQEGYTLRDLSRGTEIRIGRWN